MKASEAAEPESGGESGPRDRAAEISRLFREHNRTLVSFLASRLKDEQAAKEVAQEAYVKLLQLERLGAVGFLRAYLFRIAQNLAIDRIRQEQNRARLDQREGFEELFEDATAERSVMARQEYALIQRAIAELPPKYQQAFRGHRLEERSFEELAAAMKLKPRMVRHYVTLSLVYIRLRRAGVDAAAAWGKIHA